MTTANQARSQPAPQPLRHSEAVDGLTPEQVAYIEGAIAAFRAQNSAISNQRQAVVNAARIALQQVNAR